MAGNARTRWIEFFGLPEMSASREQRLRRAARLFEAAEEAVQKLIDLHSESAKAKMSPSSTTRDEIDLIRQTLSDELTLSDGLRNLFSKAAGAGDGSDPKVQRFGDTLSSLIRGLRAERRACEALASPTSAAVAEGAESASGDAPFSSFVYVMPDIKPTKKQSEDGDTGESGDKPLTPNEAALLASLTEKFYKTWSFRIIGMAMLASVVLSATGALLIGEKSFDLRKELQDTGERGVNQLQAQIKLLNSETADAKKQIKDIENEFETVASRSQDLLIAKIDKFQDKSNDIKKDIAATVTQNLKTELDAKVSEIAGEIAARKKDALDRVSALEAQLKPLDGEIQALVSAISTLKTRIDAQDKQAKENDPGLKRLADLMSQLDGDAHRLSTFEASANRAELQANMAQIQADSAKSSAAKASSFAEAAAARLAAIDGTKAPAAQAPDLSGVVGAIKAAAESLSHAPPSPSLDVKPFTTQLSDMQKVYHEAEEALRTKQEALHKELEDLNKVVANLPKTDLQPLDRRVDELDAAMTILKERLKEWPPQIDVRPFTEQVAAMQKAALDRMREIEGQQAILRTDVNKLRDAPRSEDPRAAAASGEYMALSLRMRKFLALTPRLDMFSSEEITKLQLIAQMPKKEADGSAGPRTLRAIEAYRRANGAKSTGPMTFDDIVDLLNAKSN